MKTYACELRTNSFTVLPQCHSFTCLKQKEATLMKNKLSHYFTLPSLFSLPVPDILFSPHFTLQQSSFFKKAAGEHSCLILNRPR